MERRLGIVAEEFIKSEFPEIWPDIEEFAKRHYADVSTVASTVMAVCILPMLIEHGFKMIEQSMPGINKLCSDGVDRELDEISKLK